MWGHPMLVLGAVCSFLEPFRGHLSPNIDNVSEKLTFEIPPQRALGGPSGLPSHLPQFATSPYALRPTPYTLHSTPYTLHPALYTQHQTPTPYTQDCRPAVRSTRGRLRLAGRQAPRALAQHIRDANGGSFSTLITGQKVETCGPPLRGLCRRRRR